METPIVPRDRLDLVAVARLLVLLQGAVLVAATAESVLFLTVIGPAAGSGMVLSAVAVLLTLLSAAGLTRGSRLARRWTIVAEVGVLAFVALDLAVGLAVGGVDVTVLAAVLRVGVPIAVIAILCRRDVRSRFARVGGVA